METLLLVVLLLAPIAMIAVAVRVRRARESGAPAIRPWDKSFRNAMLLSIAGVLLAGSGLYAFSLAKGRLAPLFAAPVIAGVVLLVSGYRTWMRGVEQVPDDASA